MVSRKTKFLGTEGGGNPAHPRAEKKNSHAQKNCPPPQKSNGPSFFSRGKMIKTMQNMQIVSFQILFKFPINTNIPSYYAHYSKNGMFEIL